MTPEPETNEFILSSLHPGTSVGQVQAATGWDLRVSPDLQETPPPAATELEVLRDLNRRTALAHGDQA